MWVFSSLGLECVGKVNTFPIPCFCQKSHPKKLFALEAILEQIAALRPYYHFGREDFDRKIMHGKLVFLKAYIYTQYLSSARLPFPCPFFRQKRWKVWGSQNSMPAVLYCWGEQTFPKLGDFYMWTSLAFYCHIPKPKPLFSIGLLVCEQLCLVWLHFYVWLHLWPDYIICLVPCRLTDTCFRSKTDVSTTFSSREKANPKP